MARKWSTRSWIHRALKVTTDPMKGEDVKALQIALNKRARARGLATVTVDGVFGPQTLKAVLLVGYALGALDGTIRKGQGTIGLQRMIRVPASRTPGQRKRAKDRRVTNVAYPINPKHLIADTWGYHPGAHDGVDLICPPNEPLRAVCDATVVRVSPAGWWGLGAPSDPGLKAKGDGVIILRAARDVGPIRKGTNFVYGHAEHATVREGDRVAAGQVIGRAGLANAWHVHFCVNGRADTKGVGDRDPAPILKYLKGKEGK